MSNDVEKETDDRVVVIGVEESYWLLSGEEYLSAMLSGEEYYPIPVIYCEYDSLYELNMDLGEGVVLNALWGIHPGIIGRLRRDEHIKEERK